MKYIFRSIYWFIQPIFDPVRMLRNLLAYPGYFCDIYKYSHLKGAEPHGIWSLRPILEDKTKTSTFDTHYVYLGAWAFRHIAKRRPEKHVDVGSQIGWVTCVAGVVDTVFIDIRPFTGSVAGLTSIAGSVLAMPYPDSSLQSLSCLHVAEHIGLGRYGDPLDPLGTRKAIQELARTVAVDGRLYFGLPIGRSSTVFNAHRIHNPLDIIKWFKEEGLRLEEFAAVSDQGDFSTTIAPHTVCEANYACGMFIFSRRLG